MPSRKTKRSASSLVPAPASPVHDDDSKDDGPNSERRGRKESEQKRRVVMNQYFDELIALLSLLSQRHIPKKMDKVATLRETITCLKVYHDLTSLEPPTATEEVVINRGNTLSLLLDSQDAFLVLISDSGRVMFSTTLVTSLLGYVQTRLISQNWYDYIHDQDKEVVHSLFSECSSKKGWRIPNTTVTAFPSQTCTLRLRLYPGETGGFPQFLPFKCLTYVRKWGVEENIVDDDPQAPKNP